MCNILLCKKVMKNKQIIYVYKYIYIYCKKEEKKGAVMLT